MYFSLLLLKKQAAHRAPPVFRSAPRLRGCHRIPCEITRGGTAYEGVHGGIGGQPQRGQVHGFQRADGAAAAHRQLVRQDGGGSRGAVRLGGGHIPPGGSSGHLLPPSGLAGGGGHPRLSGRRRGCDRGGAGRLLPAAEPAPCGAAALPHGAHGGLPEHDGRSPPPRSRAGRQRAGGGTGRAGGDDLRP